MKYTISHDSKYTFENPIFLEPHTFRFYPRQSPHCRLLAYHLEVTPTPEGTGISEESSGTIAQQCWFEGLHHTLQIRARMSVEIPAHNPFSFFISPPENAQLPIQYDATTLTMMAAAMNALPLGQAVTDFANNIRANTAGNTMTFLTTMTRDISSRFTAVTRDDGPPLPPEETFASRQGSCRDLAWLQIQLLRHNGIAARFVSGYCYLVTDEKPDWELHAWVEAYIPGAGWFGLDPTHGLTCAMNHIPIAASPFPEQTMPVSGSFRGAGMSTLENRIHIECTE
ncbi:MAG: transglutaminase family protein [Deltaproteobacteria bacterium]|nr:transglutaminase family protein [Deltaproteobacteria bacterium]